MLLLKIGISVTAIGLLSMLVCVGLDLDDAFAFASVVSFIGIVLMTIFLLMAMWL